ncbi:MAG: hypothetical protein AAGE01_22320 [Pseudomonadota bacterium]
MLGLILAAALSAAPAEEAPAKTAFDTTLKLEGTLMRVGPPVDADHAPKRFEVQLQAVGLAAVDDGKGGTIVTHEHPGAGSDESVEAHGRDEGHSHGHGQSHHHGPESPEDQE